MNRLEIDAVSTQMFSAVEAYFKRGIDAVKEYFRRENAETKEYARRELEAVEARMQAKIEAVEARAQTKLDELQRRSENGPATADAGVPLAELEELKSGLKNCERRATRHSDHLLGLERRVKKLEGKEI